jgi:hypothetical protein
MGKVLGLHGTLEIIVHDRISLLRNDQANGIGPGLP